VPGHVIFVAAEMPVAAEVVGVALVVPAADGQELGEIRSTGGDRFKSGGKD